MEERQLESLRQAYEKCKPRIEGRFGPSEQPALQFLESRLNVTLPQDFKAIAQFFSGGPVGDFFVKQISDDTKEGSIIFDTELLRKYGNSPNCIVLQNDECGMLYLLTDGSVPCVLHTARMPIADAIASGRVFQTWANFYDFFRSMVQP